MSLSHATQDAIREWLLTHPTVWADLPPFYSDQWAGPDRRRLDVIARAIQREGHYSQKTSLCDIRGSVFRVIRLIRREADRSLRRSA